MAFDWWARDLADKPTPYATLAKKVHIKKKKQKKPETKVTALAKLSAPLMLRYGTGSCLEAAQHSLGSQHSPRGSGWNGTPLTISHLVYNRINSSRMALSRRTLFLTAHPHPLHTSVPTHFKSSELLWTSFTACLSSPLDAGQGTEELQRMSFPGIAFTCKSWHCLCLLMVQILTLQAKYVDFFLQEA